VLVQSCAIVGSVGWVATRAASVLIEAQPASNPTAAHSPKIGIILRLNTMSP
jgi:hypothetical protein